jgi:hypothetical protein
MTFQETASQARYRELQILFGDALRDLRKRRRLTTVERSQEQLTFEDKLSSRRVVTDADLAREIAALRAKYPVTKKMVPTAREMSQAVRESLEAFPIETWRDDDPPPRRSTVCAAGCGKPIGPRAEVVRFRRGVRTTTYHAKCAPRAGAMKELPMSLETFASHVHETARRLPDWTGAAYGNLLPGSRRAPKAPHAVYIDDVYRALSHFGLDRAKFKRRLLEAHGAGLVELSRGAPGMSLDPATFRASATRGWYFVTVKL